MTVQKILHPRVREEAQKNPPRVAEHHDERRQLAPRAADLQVAEMPPVHFRLLARKAAQPLALSIGNGSSVWRMKVRYPSITDLRGGGPILDSPACASTRRTTP